MLKKQLFCFPIVDRSSSLINTPPRLTWNHIAPLISRKHRKHHPKVEHNMIETLTSSTSFRLNLIYQIKRIVKYLLAMQHVFSMCSKNSRTQQRKFNTTAPDTEKNKCFHSIRQQIRFRVSQKEERAARRHETTYDFHAITKVFSSICCSLLVFFPLTNELIFKATFFSFTSRGKKIVAFWWQVEKLDKKKRK